MTTVMVHPTAVVDADVVLGEGTKVWHFVHVSSGARIGRGCVLGQNVFVGRNVRIGDGVKVQNNVSIFEGVEIDSDAFLGPSCVFTNVVNPRAFLERKDEFRATRVGCGATVGANATIICGHDLGPYCLVGAGSVVPRGVRAYELVVGNPARRIGLVCGCGVRLPERQGEVACAACASSYRITGPDCVALSERFMNRAPKP
jgi:UDP-2-acetamido-3-amino-2,3-dideoxy-glucuronate N-acetyltransferase